MTTEQDSLFLPDFCDVRTVFLGVLLSEWFAIVFVLVPLGQKDYGWIYVGGIFLTDLAMVSLFIQWVTLTSMGLLCLSRRWLERLESNIHAGILSYLFILMIVLLTSELAWLIEEGWLSTASVIQTSYYAFILKNLILSAIVGILAFSAASYYNLLKKSTLIITYVSLLLVTLILSELAFFFLTIPASHQQAGQHLLFIFRNLSMGVIIGAIAIRYFYIQYYWKQETVANANAQMQALQARIHPHFLFNSMNIIASLIRFQPEKAEQAVEDLSALFRATLAEGFKPLTFAEELTICQQYLRIESLRLEERLQVEWHIANIPQDALLPPLCLQPLLENAIYHSIQYLTEGGTVIVTGLFDGQQIKIEVENPTVSLPHSREITSGIAQHNIHQRLQIYYGETAGLTVHEQSGLYRVSLRFPYWH